MFRLIRVKLQFGFELNQQTLWNLHLFIVYVHKKLQFLLAREAFKSNTGILLLAALSLSAKP